MSARRYTEQQFRDVVTDPGVTTIAEVCRRVGLAPRGGNYESVRRYAAELGLDIQRLEPPSSARQEAADRAAGVSDHAYTDDELRAAVADPSVDGYPALCKRLGLRRSSHTYRRLRDRAEVSGIELPREWSRGRRRTAPAFDDVDVIRRAVADATSLADVLRAIERPRDSWNYKRLRATLELHDLELSHLPPRSRRGSAASRSLSDLLVAGRLSATTVLRKRLLSAGLKEHRCEGCQRTAWRGRPIPLELDHIDGDRRNNELGNLRLLCPNCHALTPTYRGRNIGRRANAKGDP